MGSGGSDGERSFSLRSPCVVIERRPSGVVARSVSVALGGVGHGLEHGFHVPAFGFFG